MPILVTCPTCGTNAAAPDNAGGKKVKCPKCQAILDVPAPQAPVVEVAPPAAPVAQYTPPPSAYPPPVPEPEPRRRRRDEEEDEEPRRRRRDEDDDEPRRRRGGRFACPYCGSTAPPREREEISQAGWIVFVVLILFCIPLCWIPLISMKEKIRNCSDCGSKLG
jgi:lipopolysaccharide-induced tumor necrosis factor-alpha factor